MSNNPIEITVEDVFEAAIKLAADYPGYQYSKAGSDPNTACYYTAGGCDKYPALVGCIVGQAIVAAVADSDRETVLAWLRQQDGRLPIGVYRLLYNATPRLPECPVTFVARRQPDGKHASHKVREAVAGLAVMQRAQDVGRVWKVAADEAANYNDEDCNTSFANLAYAIVDNSDSNEQTQ